MASIKIKKGSEDFLHRHHPWIFSGAVKEPSGPVRNGETVTVISSQGRWLASGAYSPHSQIRVRVWSFEQDEDITEQFFRERLARALQIRAPLLAGGSLTACRLVNAESDGMPGLIVDRYGDFLVCQFLAAGTEYWKPVIVEQLRSLLSVRGIFERSDTETRQMEGLEPRTGVLFGEEPPDLVEIREEDIRIYVDIRKGHKTGFYLDQRENRKTVSSFAKDCEVLNGFAYTGGFGLWALRGGARHVTNIDTSSEVLRLSEQNLGLNAIDERNVTHLEGDVFKVLRTYRDSGRQFDLIILDPPKFVTSRRQLTAGSRGYKDINLLAIKLLRPGGVLFTFSCSGHVAPALFQKIVADAALDAGRDVQILGYLGQSSDHPIALNFPEGQYLKGLMCKAL